MKLKRDFFERDMVSVARDLLGTFFVCQTPQGKIVGRIVETEAYGDVTDLASHARFGEKGRSKIMFGPAGVLYVYSIYGLFELSNIICQRAGTPSAVLLRSAEIIEGQNLVKENLRANRFVKINDKLATGPGKLSLAFGITRKLNGADATASGKIYFESKNQDNFAIIETERIGIEYARESKSFPWRFYVRDSSHVSKK